MSLFFGSETKDIGRANACTLGLCWDKGSLFRKGSAKAPAMIRDYTSSELYNSFTEVGVNIRDYWRIYDLGDINPSSITEAIPTVKDMIGKLAHPKLNIFLGGDHSITYMSLKALKETSNGSWGLVYFDAHPDLYDSYEGDRYSHACVARRLIDDGVVSPKHTIQIGIRAATAEQLDYARNKGVRILSTSDVYKMDKVKISSIVEKILSNADNIYISFDADVLDPAFAPGVGNPEGGGIMLRDVIDIIHGFKGLNIQAFDVVETNPDYDYAGITFCSTSKFIRESLGVIASKL